MKLPVGDETYWKVDPCHHFRLSSAVSHGQRPGQQAQVSKPQPQASLQSGGSISILVVFIVMVGTWLLKLLSSKERQLRGWVVAASAQDCALPPSRSMKYLTLAIWLEKFWSHRLNIKLHSNKRTHLFSSWLNGLGDRSVPIFQHRSMCGWLHQARQLMKDLYNLLDWIYHAALQCLNHMLMLA